MTMVAPRDVLYCGACGMPPEYCEYGPDYESHCLKWLLKNHPDVHARLEAARGGAGKKDAGADGGAAEDEDAASSPPPPRPWTTEERLRAFYAKYEPTKLDNVPSLLEKYEGREDKLFAALVKKYGDEPEDPYVAAATRSGADGDGGDGSGDEADKLAGMNLGDKKKRRGVGAKRVTKMDTRVVIQKISRNRKKAVTIVVGLDTVPDLNLKDAAKAFSKRFAGSSSVKDTPQGTKEIIIQGNHSEECAEMIVSKFKVPADSVFLDVDGEFVPFGGGS